MANNSGKKNSGQNMSRCARLRIGYKKLGITSKAILWISLISLVFTFIAWCIAISSIGDMQKLINDNAEIIANSKQTILGLNQTILGNQKAIENTENALKILEETVSRTNPVNLSIWHVIDEENKRLCIYGKNEDRYRPTGTIHLYRLEVDPHRPHLQLTGNDTLGPGEEKMLFNLTLEIERVNISKNKIVPLEGLSGAYNVFKFSKYYDLYFCEECYISYRITCDNCPAQGIIRKTIGDDWSSFNFALTIDMQNNETSAAIPIHEWVVRTLDDIRI